MTSRDDEVFLDFRVNLMCTLRTFSTLALETSPKLGQETSWARVESQKTDCIIQCRVHLHTIRSVFRVEILKSL